MSTRIKRAATVVAGTALATAAAVVTAAPASASAGETCVRTFNGVCTATVHVNAYTYEGDGTHLYEIGGGFNSFTPGDGIQNPRLHVRVLDRDNRELLSREWSGVGNVQTDPDRSWTIDRKVTGRVCSSLYENGGLLGTACVGVYP